MNPAKSGLPWIPCLKLKATGGSVMSNWRQRAAPEATRLTITKPQIWVTLDSQLLKEVLTQPVFIFLYLRFA